MTTVQRVFLYLASFIGLSLAVVGIMTLIEVLVREGFDAFNGFSASSNAGTLTILIIGAVTWRYFWWSVQNEASGSEAQQAAGMRKLYLYGVMTIALLGTLILIQTILSGFVFQLFSGDLSRFAPWTEVLSTLLLFTVWRYHKDIADDERSAETDNVRGSDLQRTYWFALVFFGVSGVISGLNDFFEGLISHLGGRAPGFGFLGETPWLQSLLTPVVGLVVAGIAIRLFWLPSQQAAESGDETERSSRLRSLLIHVTVLAVVVSVLGSIQEILSDLLGRLLSGFPSGLFVLSVANALAALIVGGLLVWYFITHVRDTLSSSRLSDYIVSGVAYVILVSTFINILTAIFLGLGGESPRDFTPLIVQIVPPLLVGGVVWRWRWKVLEDEAGGGDSADARLYLWRSVYLYLYQFIGLVLALVGGVTILQTILTGIFGQPVFDNLFIILASPLAMLIVGLGMYIYAGRTITSDRVVLALPAEEVMKQTLGDSVPSWAIASVLMFLVVPVLLIGGLAALGPVIGSIFEGITQGLVP